MLRSKKAPKGAPPKTSVPPSFIECFDIEPQSYRTDPFTDGSGCSFLVDTLQRKRNKNIRTRKKMILLTVPTRKKFSSTNTGRVYPIGKSFDCGLIVEVTESVIFFNSPIAIVRTKSQLETAQSGGFYNPLPLRFFFFSPLLFTYHRPGY